MASTTKHCKICGAQYDYCPTCGRDINKPKWYVSFDRPECKKLFDVLAANGSGQLSAEKTLDELKAMNYRSMKITNQSVLSHIARIENAQSEFKAEAASKVEPELARDEQAQTQPKDQSESQIVDSKDMQEVQDVQEEKKEFVESIESDNNQSFKKNKNKNKNEGSSMPSFLGYADRVDSNSSIG